MYNEQNCLQFDALSFLSFVPVMTEHAKALYKLRLVLVNAKGSNTVVSQKGAQYQISAHPPIIASIFCKAATAFVEFSVFAEPANSRCHVVKFQFVEFPVL